MRLYKRFTITIALVWLRFYLACLIVV